MTVVVHTFVADSSLLDCCDLVGGERGGGGILFFFFFFFSPLMLAGRQPFEFFKVISALLFLSFGVSCLLAWLGQPFFVCHQHLWFGLSFFATGINLWSVLSFFATGICVQSLSFTAFSAVGIRVRLFVSALLAPVSGIRVSLSFWYHAVRLLLVSFILGDSNWNFFQVGYPVDSPTNSALKQTPFGILP